MAGILLFIMYSFSQPRAHHDIDLGRDGHAAFAVHVVAPTNEILFRFQQRKLLIS